MTRRPSRLGGAALLALLCTAPTPGDVGGCGQVAQDLDPGVFFDTKQETDCTRCDECGLLTDSCAAACAPAPASAREFPPGCYPLVHDGEVCLRALDVASCDDYLEYMDDAVPSVPSECDFCPARGEGE